MSQFSYCNLIVGVRIFYLNLNLKKKRLWEILSVTFVLKVNHKHIHKHLQTGKEQFVLNLESDY